MRKIILLFILVILSTYLKAQVTLEHSFTATSDTSITYSVYNVNETLNNTEIVNYLLYDSRDSNISIYNVDYSLKNTIKLTPPENYKFSSIQLASTKLFNTDEAIEFLISYSNSNGDIIFKMFLYDENGNILYDFGKAYSAYAYIANNQFKLVTNDYPVTYTNFPTEYTYEYNIKYYLLEGEVSTTDGDDTDTDGEVSNKTSDIKISSNNLPYPNPSTSYVNLTYSIKNGERAVMNIYNINGKFIEQKIIDSHFDKIILNISEYTPGIYFYEVNGNTKKFIVK
ncbi:MAG: T9SS type A sorting domain-containing protein [Bacteroidales bacterium]|jgi:hypothetical protein|nr:T9SS type A sorting domain-containing protein [Bacteroidales bacterium]